MNESMGSLDVNALLGSKSFESRLNEELFEYRADEIRDVGAFFDNFAEILTSLSPTEYFEQELAHGNFIENNYFSERKTHWIYNYVRLHRSNSHLNYRDPSIFVGYDQSYFYLNLYKSLIACSFLRKQVLARQIYFRYDTLVDIGSGAGTFTLAAAKSLPRLFRHFHLIDYAPLQIEVSKLLLNLFDVQNFECHLGTPQHLYHARGLRVASYWLCGNTDMYKIPAKEIKAMLSRDGLVIIDYKERLAEFSDRFIGLTKRVRPVHIKCHLPQAHAKMLNKETINVQMLMTYGS